MVVSTKELMDGTPRRKCAICNRVYPVYGPFIDKEVYRCLRCEFLRGPPMFKKV